MPVCSVYLDPATERLYRHVAAAAGVSLEQVLADALFKLAGELALESLAKPRRNES